MNKTIAIGIGIFVYLLTSVASYSYFNANTVQVGTVQIPTPAQTGGVIEGGPLTEECPLNGQLYTKEQKQVWEKRRPAGVMIQNHIESRPQSGLSSADVVHEAIAEGGITRFLAMFYCENPTYVGSVRSARIYYIRLLQGFGDRPIYLHVGGAATDGPADALNEIVKLGWSRKNDLDNLTGVGIPVLRRYPDRLPDKATEHTMYGNTIEMWKWAAEKSKLTHVDEEGTPWNEGWEGWTFDDDAKEGARGAVSSISFGFWDDSLGSDYSVKWQYDKAANSYKRFNAGEPHIDFNNKKQLTAKNVVVIFVDESEANDGYEHGQHMLYDVLGEGKAIMFHNGEAIKGTWQKAKATDMMRFYDLDDKELSFVRGKIWIEVLPTGNKVEYK